jgi:hypothetical protein
MLLFGLCDQLGKGPFRLYKVMYGFDLDIVIIQIIESLSPGLKVITLSGFNCTTKNDIHTNASLDKIDQFYIRIKTLLCVKNSLVYYFLKF